MWYFSLKILDFFQTLERLVGGRKSCVLFSSAATCSGVVQFPMKVNNTKSAPARRLGDGRAAALRDSPVRENSVRLI